MTSRMLAKHIASHAIGRKARNVVLMDLRKLSGATDFFVICTGDSDTQVKAIADGIQDGMSERGQSVWHSEGFQARQWILLDYVDVVVHVFHKEIRHFYNLERLWSDAKIHPVEDTGKTVKILPAVKAKPPRAQRTRRTASAR
ncbi:MAG: ribosome silencing factor [Bacteroidota bacterium]